MESHCCRRTLLPTDICPIYTVADMTYAGETAANKMTMMMTARLYKLELELDGWWTKKLGSFRRPYHASVCPVVTWNCWLKVLQQHVVADYSNVEPLGDWRDTFLHAVWLVVRTVSCCSLWVCWLLDTTGKMLLCQLYLCHSISYKHRWDPYASVSAHVNTIPGLSIVCRKTRVPISWPSRWLSVELSPNIQCP